MIADTWVQVGATGGIVVVSHLLKVAFEMGQSREREKAARATETQRIAREVARDALWDKRHEEHTVKLDAIETQTTITNGRVGKHDTTLIVHGEEIARLRDQPRCQDCPNRDRPTAKRRR